MQLSYGSSLASNAVDDANAFSAETTCVAALSDLCEVHERQRDSMITTARYEQR